MSKPGISSLIYPLAKENFFSSHWPKKPFVVHGLSESVSSLTQLPFLASLDSLLNSWPNLVQVHLPDVKDESSSVEANVKEARTHFNSGMALLFNNVQSISPELVDWLKALKKDLGLPASTYARCMVYATPDGKGTTAHFDQNINFVLQIHGVKKWRIAANINVENPTQRHVIGQPLDPELDSYLEIEMPNSMPEHAQEVVLAPGSMLFVPRGFWHSTEAAGEALALNFTFSQPTWADLLTLALKSRLNLSSEWRELADGVSSDDLHKRALAQEKFDMLLAELVHDLPNWRAEDILNSTEE